MNKFTMFNQSLRKAISRKAFAILCLLFSLNVSAQVSVGVDPTFTIGTGFDGPINCMVLQSDGKIIVGGYFTNYNGVARGNIARLNANGTLDNSFTTGAGFAGSVSFMVLQADGKILVGGSFTSYNGVARNRIARLNADGTLDNSFTVGTGFNLQDVRCMVLQSDGKILAGGGFMSYNGVTRNNIARLNADGTLDNSFTVGTGFNMQVRYMVLQSDGKILVGGAFTNYNGVAQNRIARLNSNGTLDNSFFTVGAGLDNQIFSMVLQADGKILVGGDFTSYNGVARGRIARLNSNGTLDSSFLPTGTGFGGNSVFSMVLQADGKILVGGTFVSYNGVAQNRIARLNADGTLDNSFTVGTGLNSYITSMVLQAGGKILVGGVFTYYNGVAQDRITRLQSTVCALSTPTITASSTNLCSGGNVILTSSAVSDNLWSNGATTQSIIVSNAGSYTVRTISGACTSAVSAASVVTLTSGLPTNVNFTTATYCADPKVITLSADFVGVIPNHYWAVTGTGASVVSQAPTVTGLVSKCVVTFSAVPTEVQANVNAFNLCNQSSPITKPYPLTGLHTYNSISPTALDCYIGPERKGKVEPIASDIVLYPNPAVGELTVRLPEGEQAATIQIVDVLGKTQAARVVNSNESKISLQGLAAGVYSVAIQMQDKTITKKLVVKL